MQIIGLVFYGLLFFLQFYRASDIVSLFMIFCGMIFFLLVYFVSKSIFKKATTLNSLEKKRWKNHLANVIFFVYLWPFYYFSTLITKDYQLQDLVFYSQEIFEKNFYGVKCNKSQYEKIIGIDAEEVVGTYKTTSFYFYPKKGFPACPTLKVSINKATLEILVEEKSNLNQSQK